MATVYRDVVLAPLFEAARAHAALYSRIDRAYALMLTECGVLSAVEGAGLLNGLAWLDSSDELAQRRDAGDYEDLFFVREALLRERLGADLAGRLHTGRSRNDFEATVFRLQSKEQLLQLVARTVSLTQAVLELAEREAATPILAYTHGQPAQPTTYGHYLMAFAEVLLRDLARIQAALHDTDACPLGASAITTTGFPIDRARLAELLGFARVQVNSYGCIAAADPFAAAQLALQLLFINFGRLVQDLAFWTSFEVGQARAGDGFVQISSIMPQKRNPLAIEHLRAMASLGVGHCQTAVVALHNTPFADMVDAEGPTQTAARNSYAMAERVIPLLEAILRDMTIDTARVRHNIDRSCAAMTELADSLVRQEGISFRAAHEIASALANGLVSRGHGMEALQGEEITAVFEQHIGRPPVLGTAQLRSLCEPAHFIAIRDRVGGPAATSMAAAMRSARDALSAVKTWQQVIRQREATAEKALCDAVQQRSVS